MTKRTLIGAIIALISFPGSAAFAHPGHSDLISGQGNAVWHYLVAPQHGLFAIATITLFAVWMGKPILDRFRGQNESGQEA